MTELYLRLISRGLTPVMLVLAVFLLLRGHNNPGGGFIAGLVVAAVLQLQIMSRGEASVRSRIGRYLHPMMGSGLLITAAAGIVGVFYGKFLKGVWWHITLGSFALDLGTPVAFDIGVFLVVVSVITSYLLGLNSREPENGGGQA